LKHIYCTLAFFEPKTVVKLYCAQVGKEQNIGGDFAGYGLSGDLLRVFQGRALAAYTQRDMVFLGGLRQALVYQTGLFGSSRHGRNQDGRSQFFAKKGKRCIYRRQVKFR
jgi:hypothetical protein